MSMKVVQFDLVGFNRMTAGVSCSVLEARLATLRDFMKMERLCGKSIVKYL